LNSFENSLTKTPLSTPVDAVPPLTIIRDPEKKVSFALPNETTIKKKGWGRKRARRIHLETKTRANNILSQRRRRLKAEDKRRKKRARRRANTPTGVLDTGATSTVVKQNDKQYVEVLKQSSGKVFANPNGTSVMQPETLILCQI
jgi:hypothetical protein